MAGFTFNIAKGRVGEFFFRVKNNDPTNSALIALVLKELNLEGDAGMIDRDSLNDVLVTGSSDEATNSGYVRKTLTDADLGTLVPDDANDRFDYDIPDLAYTTVAGDGTATNNWRKLLLCYDGDTTAGTDANITPLLAQDVVVNPDGSNITLQIATTGIWRAQ